MKPNEGTLDRRIRGGLAAVLAIAGLRAHKKAKKVALLGAATFVGATAITGFCPAYQILGKNTLDKD